MTARIVADDEAGREVAIEALRGGGIVALPTDTVYGIAVAPATPDGIERLFRAKDRPPDKAIALLVADADQAAAIGAMTAAATALAGACWPGGLTLVLRPRAGVPSPAGLSGGQPTVGLRVPDHPAPRALARAVGPLPTTSANVSGRPEASDAAEILAVLGEAVEIILDGGRAHGGPASTVVDCTVDPPRVLRVGAIQPARLTAILAPHGLGLEVPPS